MSPHKAQEQTLEGCPTIFDDVIAWGTIMVASPTTYAIWNTSSRVEELTINYTFTDRQEEKPEDQSWFWSEKCQKILAQAEDDVKQGRVKRFLTMRELRDELNTE